MPTTSRKYAALFIAIMIVAPIAPVVLLHYLGCEVYLSKAANIIIGIFLLFGALATYGLVRRWPAALLYLPVAAGISIFLTIPGFIFFGECK